MLDKKDIIFALENKYLAKWLETTDTTQVGFKFPSSTGTSQIFTFSPKQKKKEK